MAKEIPSVGDLRRKFEVTDDEIQAAADAYPKDEGAQPFTFKSGHRIDVRKAIDMHSQAKKLLADEATTPGLRRTMVMTAVIMGFPVESKAMTEPANSNIRTATAAIQHMMRRLDSFARGLGFDEVATRQIIETVVADMPVRTDEERLIEARMRMIEASV